MQQVISSRTSVPQREPILHHIGNLDHIEHYVTKDPQCLSNIKSQIRHHDFRGTKSFQKRINCHTLNKSINEFIGFKPFRYLDF